MPTKSFDLERLSAVQLVPITPFSPDGKRLLSGTLAKLVRRTYAAGIRVFIPGAGTGEFHSLSTAEVIACTQLTREAAGEDATVVTPIGFGLQHALTIGHGAIEAGADALLIMPPVHPYLSDAGFEEYARVLHEELPLPLLAYKKGPVPSDRALGELGTRCVLAGVKYAVNDLDAFTRFADAHAAQLGLYCGTAERFAPFFMLAGAKGFTSGAANLCPRLSLAMFRALSAGNYAEGLRLLGMLRPIEDCRALEGESFNISLLKYGASLLGEDFGPARAPQRLLNADHRAMIRRMLEPILKAEAELERGAA